MVDATGVWAADPEHPFSSRSIRILPSRGAHLVVPRERIPATAGLTIRVPGKVVFLVPWPDHWLIGTTDAPYEGRSARPAADGWEIDELLRTVNDTLDVDLQRSDVVGTYAGLRPLIAPSGGSTVKASREHRVTVEKNGIVRISGGKYTTYRVMARDVIDAVLGREGAERLPSATADRRLVGAADRPHLDRIVAEIASIPAVAAAHPDAAARLVARHGTEALGVVALGGELDLLRPLVPGRPYPRGRGGVGRAARARAVGRRRPVASPAPEPRTRRPRRRRGAAGRGDHGPRARLGRGAPRPRGRGVPRDGRARVRGRAVAVGRRVRAEPALRRHGGPGTDHRLSRHMAVTRSAASIARHALHR